MNVGTGMCEPAVKGSEISCNYCKKKHSASALLW